MTTTDNSSAFLDVVLSRATFVFTVSPISYTVNMLQFQFMEKFNELKDLVSASVAVADRQSNGADGAEATQQQVPP